jgi:hypothetical protein
MNVVFFACDWSLFTVNQSITLTWNNLGENQIEISIKVNLHYNIDKFVGCPYSKIGVVRTVQKSHVTLFCSIPIVLVFRKSGVLRTVNGAS